MIELALTNYNAVQVRARPRRRRVGRRRVRRAGVRAARAAHERPGAGGGVRRRHRVRRHAHLHPVVADPARLRASSPCTRAAACGATARGGCSSASRSSCSRSSSAPATSAPSRAASPAPPRRSGVASAEVQARIRRIFLVSRIELVLLLARDLRHGGQARHVTAGAVPRPRSLESPHGSLRPRSRRDALAGDLGARGRLRRAEPRPGRARADDLTYVLEMLPYPRASCTWATSRTTRWATSSRSTAAGMGYRVMHPMGYDAFGLPAENAAIRSGRHPAESTRENIAAIRRQMKRMGWSIDWKRELSTADPEYYRWTQWIFLRLYEAGLAYRKSAAVKWCPNDQTVLANEQVIDGRCERCGAEVEARTLEQWLFKITAYADRLLDDLAEVHWPERVVTMQRNWIGRSHGAEVELRARRRHRPERVHHPARHALRRHVLRARAGAPAGGRARRRRRARAGRGRLRAPHRRPLGGRAGRGAREDRRLHRPLRHEPGERRADPGVGGRLRAGRVRHRRDHGRAGPRRARLRVRPGTRPRDPAGRGSARRRGRRPTSPTRRTRTTRCS